MHCRKGNSQWPQLRLSDRGNPALLAPRRANGFDGMLGQFAHMVGRWRSRNRLRADLAHLLQTAPRLIEDIGLEPNEVRREVIKPFWRFEICPPERTTGERAWQRVEGL